MKLKYANAYTDNNDIDNNMKFSIDAERQIESSKFIEIVEGRLEEIIENVWYQIPSDYYDKLLGGIILTGGGSNMPNIDKAFMNHTRIEKVRIANFVTQTVNATQEDIKAKNGMMNTVLGLLAKGDMNCAGEEYDPNGNLFKPQPQPTPMGLRTPRKPGEIAPGVIRTEAEKQLAEEEARRKREEEEEEARIAKEQEEARLAEERRKNSLWNKAFRGLKKFGETIIKEED